MLQGTEYMSSEEAKKVKEVILVDCRLEFVFLSSVDFTVIVKVLFDSCILINIFFNIEQNLWSNCIPGTVGTQR